MKKVLFLMLCIITFNANSQDTIVSSIDTTSNSAGDELMLAYKQHLNGSEIFGLGAGVMFLGNMIYASGGDNVGIEVIIVGGIVSLIGSVIQFNSWRHFDKAGLLMNERGVGLKINL